MTKLLQKNLGETLFYSEFINADFSRYLGSNTTMEKSNILLPNHVIFFKILSNKININTL
jgi:hypothetical protein